MLEVLVETVLAGTLEGVAQEGGRPTEEDAAQALLGEDGPPCRDVGCVDFGVDLTTALDEIKGCDGGVCWTCVRRNIGSIEMRGKGGAIETELRGTYHKLYTTVSIQISYCHNDHHLSKAEIEDIPIMPPRAQLRKYLPELGSIFPKGSLRSCRAMVAGV